ncbi:MAG TPA: hypothetical protein VGA36_01745 [Nitriliruptorales bacterium]
MHKPPAVPTEVTAPDTVPDQHRDEGSMVTEYGLVAVVGATIAALAINWATNGNIYDLFSAVLAKVKVLVGA